MADQKQTKLLTFQHSKIMKKLITLTALILCSFAMLHAETPEHRKETPHEIRIGIADNYYEFHNHPIESAKHLAYQTGHIFAEYQYRVNDWFSAGCNVDYIHSWTQPCDCNHSTDFSSKITILPTARFTYLNYKAVSLYNSLSIGLHYAYHSPLSKQDNIEEGFGLGLDACLIGLSIGKSHWFGTFELGATRAITYRKGHRKGCIIEPYLVASPSIPVGRVVRASFGYRF